MTAAYRAFVDPIAADPIDSLGEAPGGSGDWGSFASRQTRYRILWAFYQNVAFKDRSIWPSRYAADPGLYLAVRDLFGVALALGNFHRSHIHGGPLDPRAGDGVSAPSALPIVMDRENPYVRLALAELWKRSNHNLGKDVITLWGATQGDVFAEACLDVAGRTVRINPVPAGRVKACEVTAEGNVVAYQLQYRRTDPRFRPDSNHRGLQPAPVTYEEVVDRDPAGTVRYRTYLNGQAFAWPGNPSADWSYRKDLMPFVPMVHVQHANLGLGWGQAEAAPAIGGMTEVSDLASCLTDWARRAVHAPHLIAGMTKPGKDKETVTLRDGRQSEEGGDDDERTRVRQEQNLLFGKTATGAYSLVHNLPVEGIGGQIDRLRRWQLDNYPELAYEKLRLSGEASGESFREARKPAATKVDDRRTPYDAGSERLFKMAITLGGIHGFGGYERFDIGSYQSGDLDFRIGARPAFAVDAEDRTADRLAKYAALKAATDAGLPIDLAMEEAGYDPATIAKVVADRAQEQARAAKAAVAVVSNPVPSKES